jgi:signal transduction histidine kinase
MGPEAASRVVGNLLDNAVTYNRPGGTVEVTLEQAGDRVRLTVRDTGRGIPAEERARVFERFHRAARDVRGTGLGLAIVRELVTAAGGDIDLRSREGEGTTVIVHLPAAAPGR